MPPPYAGGQDTSEPVDLFPVNVNPGRNRPAAWYPWEPQDLKELRKAVAEDGPNSPWADTLIEGMAHQALVPRDWRDLAKAVLCF